MGAGFLNPLTLEYVDGRRWKITKAFSYHLGLPDGAEYVEIPENFLTDFASIPRFLWPLLPPTGSYGKPAVVHDWLYQKRYVMVRVEIAGLAGIEHTFVVPRTISRMEADATLLEAMQVIGTRWYVRWPIYLGVRLGGWIPWSHYRYLDAQGDSTCGSR